MAAATHPVVETRLAELVRSLSGTDDDTARGAVSAAKDVHGGYGDPLLNVAAALVNLREPIETPA
jgi:hypothetical protein